MMGRERERERENYLGIAGSERSCEVRLMPEQVVKIVEE